jgi:hypothetical protein
MKIERKVEEPAFKPIKLELTIEFEQELAALKAMTSMNITLPKFVGRERTLPPGGEKVIEKFLDLMQFQLEN